MTQIGEIRTNAKSQKYIWACCNICGKARWVQLIKENPVYARCYECAMKAQRRGRRYIHDGYMMLTIYNDNPYYCMGLKKNGFTPNRRIAEHRLIMAQILGRPLSESEVVHHINGNKLDNRPENLRLVTLKQHSNTYAGAYREGFQNGTKMVDTGLKKEIRLLQWQIKELREALQLKLGEG